MSVPLNTAVPPIMFAAPDYFGPPQRDGKALHESLSPIWLIRHPSYEDDNRYIARRVKRQNRLGRICHVVHSCLKLASPLSKPPTAQVVPKKRPFKWMISSHHVAEAYQDKSIRCQSPWYLLLRYLFVDPREQLENEPAYGRGGIIQ